MRTSALLLALGACADPATALFATPGVDPAADDFYALPVPQRSLARDERHARSIAVPDQQLLWRRLHRAAADELDGFRPQPGGVRPLRPRARSRQQPADARRVHRRARLGVPRRHRPRLATTLASASRCTSASTPSPRRRSARTASPMSMGPCFGLADGTTYAVVITDRPARPAAATCSRRPRSALLLDGGDTGAADPACCGRLHPAARVARRARRRRARRRRVGRRVHHAARDKHRAREIRKGVFATPAPIASEREGAARDRDARDGYAQDQEHPRVRRRVRRPELPGRRGAVPQRARRQDLGRTPTAPRSCSAWSPCGSGCRSLPAPCRPAGRIAIYQHGTGGDHLSFVEDLTGTPSRPRASP